MSEWKPGDVAMVVGDSFARGQRAMFCVDKDGRDGWAVESTDGLTMAFGNKSMRPLVVIDPEDREQVERLWQAWRDQAPDHRLAQDNLQAALREFANPTPPKPDEPTGLGAVVEDADGRRWVRDVEGYDSNGPWYRRGVANCLHYADIAAVKVLSEGVTV